METIEIKVGTLLEFDQEAFIKTAKTWRDSLFPVIENVKEEYENLEMGDFNQSVFEELLKGCESIAARFYKTLEDDIRKTKTGRLFTEAFLETEVPRRLAGLRTATANLKKVFSNVAYGSKTTPLFMEFDQIEIIDGNPVFNEVKLRAKCSRIIESESQLEEWLDWLDIQSRWNKAVDRLIRKGFDIKNYKIVSGEFDNNGFVKESKDGKLQLFPESLKMIRD
jgi:hypothetical protein